MRYLFVGLAALLAFGLSACTGVPPEEGAALIAEIEAQVRAGIISPELGQVMIQQVRDGMAGHGIDWPTIGASIGGIGLAVLSSITGVRITRGPAKPMDKSQAEVIREMIAERAAAKAAAAQTPPPQPPPA